MTNQYSIVNIEISSKRLGAPPKKNYSQFTLGTKIIKVINIVIKEMVYWHYMVLAEGYLYLLGKYMHG
jgi:hypothetical protein